MYYKKFLKKLGFFFFTVNISLLLAIFFATFYAILYCIYLRYNYLQFLDQNISYAALQKLKENNVIYDWAKLEHRRHLHNHLRRIFFLNDNIHSFRIFSRNSYTIWPMYMADLYYWCFTPFSLHIKNLNFLNLAGESYSFILEEIYLARKNVFVFENAFYLYVRSNIDYVSMEDFTFHSLHHHWLILEMHNDFATFMKIYTQQKCKEFTFKPCYDMMFTIDYLNYHIALAQAKIDAIKTYQVDLHLLKGFEEDLVDFLNLKQNLKFYGCGNKTTTIEDLHYISKADFKELRCEKAFYNEPFAKFLEKQTLVVKQRIKLG